MTFLLLLPAVLSFLILAAHFLHGQYFLAGFAASLPFGQYIMIAFFLACCASLLIPWRSLGDSEETSPIQPPPPSTLGRFILRINQALLLVGAAEWIVTAYRVYLDRQAEGRPALRPLIIFAAVGGLCLLAVFLLQNRRIKIWFGVLNDAPPAITPQP